MEKKFTQRSFDSEFSTNSEPWGITFDKQNQRIIVTTRQSPFVTVISRFDFNPIYSFGNHGSKIGEFYSPSGLCNQPFTNNLLITDYHHHRIQIFDLSEETKYKPVYTIGPKLNSKLIEFNNPIDICCDIDGSMAVINYDDNAHFFDMSGRYISSLDNSTKNCLFGACYSNSQTQQRHLYVSHRDKKISVWASSSNHYNHKHIVDVTTFGYPRGICCDLDGYVYIACETNCVEIREPRMNFSLLQILYVISIPINMCVDDNNIIMVVLRDNNKVMLFK